jgi:hypothetical protein
MYSRSAWGGDIDPFVLVEVEKIEANDRDPIMSLVIFEWKDRHLIGKHPPGNEEQEVRAPDLLRGILR